MQLKPAAAYSAPPMRRKQMTEQQRNHLEGRFASARQNYLITRKPNEFARLKRDGELKGHLALIGQEAASHYEILMAQMQETAAAMPASSEKDAYLSQMSQTAAELTLADIVYV
jgi:hypothetical protein